LFGGKPGNVPASTGAKSGGSLSDIFPGGLGGLLGGAAAGGVLSGGLANIIKELQESGHGHVAQSWVGEGPNQEIAPNDLANALGSDTLHTLSQHTGVSVDDLLAGLSQHLPDLVDQLTPHGRLPSEDEAAGRSSRPMRAMSLRGVARLQFVPAGLGLAMMAFVAGLGSTLVVHARVPHR
jgi:uncharacterized protein YidB (DUF937 family)